MRPEIEQALVDLQWAYGSNDKDMAIKAKQDIRHELKVLEEMVEKMAVNEIRRFRLPDTDKERDKLVGEYRFLAEKKIEVQHEEKT